MPDRRQQGSPKRPRGRDLLADIPADLYAAVKMRALEERRTVRQVVLRYGPTCKAQWRATLVDGKQPRTVSVFAL